MKKRLISIIPMVLPLTLMINGCGGDKSESSSSLICNGNHVYDQQVVASKFEYQAPSCSEAGIYYKSCVCGASSKGTPDEFVFYGNNKLPHTGQFNVTWNGNVPTVDITCSVCHSEWIDDDFEVVQSNKVIEYPTNIKQGKKKSTLTIINKYNPANSYIEESNELSFGIDQVNINDSTIKDYLNANTSAAAFNILKNHSNESHDSPIYVQSWLSHSSNSYKLYMSYDSSFPANATYTQDFSSTSTNFGRLIPGKTYYWKVCLNNSTYTDMIDGGAFKVDEDDVRFIKASSVGNVRDLGGWKINGTNNRVNYGMLYRGKKVDSINETDKEMFKKLGIKTEIDLRNATDLGGNPKPLEGVNYYFFDSTWHYNNVMTHVNSKTGSGQNTMITPEGKQDCLTYGGMYKMIFELLADKKNYPVYFHCVNGADRTGTLAYFINGLLGVSYEDLVKDFELTSFSGANGKRWRSNANKSNNDFDNTTALSDWINWPQLQTAVNSLSGSNLKEKIATFLTGSCGISQTTLNSVVSNLTTNSAEWEIIR